MSKEMWTTQQFALKTGFSASTIANWLRNGKLNGKKQGGKWMIAADQLSVISTAAMPKSDKKEADQTVSGDSPGSFSIKEFSAMTYLTEVGVLRWLKEGRLEGVKQSNGEWWISASSLSHPDVQRLLRK